jgi:WxL domain surface cell wall-binding
MSTFAARVRRRRLRALGAGLLAVAGATAAVSLGAGPAAASACTPGTPAASCAMSGSFALTGGQLGVAAPATLTWSAALTGYDLAVVDPTDTTLTVDDARGTGAGWNLTAAATTFTTSGSATLPNTGTFSITGSTSSASATTAPSAACASNATCVLPTESGVTYPVSITTAPSSPTPVKIYNAALNTGVGAITLSPAGWWLSVPGKSASGTYTSTITLAITTGP